jgi:succinyl-CoA synthetase beta subunit
VDLHEFQAKAVLARYGVPVPAGQVAWTPDEAARIAAELGWPRYAVKAQILAGGRGEAGGVKFTHSPDGVRACAASLLGTKLVTAQTSGAGRTVRRVYVEQAIECEREIYFGILLDRSEGRIVLLGTSGGGAAVEERMRGAPESFARLALEGTTPPSAAQLGAFVGSLGLEQAAGEAAMGLCAALVRAFVELDASLIEINPLGVTGAGKLVALDVKMSVDDNALFRHPDLQVLRDEHDVDVLELEAQRHDLNFVRMDGDIGLVVNGAGLGLATLDMLRDAGGAPANFMDIRTTAKSLQIAKGIGLLLSEPKVRAILVNVHGGGMTSCDTIVEAIHIAMRQSGRKVPIVFRAAGQNADYARRMMADRRIPHEIAPSMTAAARRAVALARGPA